jgi:signal transduction histidine kinase
MTGLETATHTGMYWTVALSIALLAGAVGALGWRLIRERRASRLEHERLTRALGELQARLDSQQRELERTNLQLAAREQRLDQQSKVLADVERARDAKAAELARANREIDARTAEITRVREHQAELLANLSNDLRTPLNSALILSKLLADNGSANLTPEQVKFARTIYGAGNDLLELLNDILDLSKVEARKIDIHPQPLEVSALVTALTETVGPIAEQKRLDLAIRLAPDLPATLDSDAQRLPQVLKNLLATAIKLTDRGTVSLDVDSQGSDIEFVVRAADATSRRTQGGTGLGLSLARELAPLLGGRIEMQSEPGQASTFRFIVPAEARMMDPAPARVGAGG